MKRAVFLDRDGTIIFDRDYLNSPSDIELIPSASAALQRFRELGFSIVVVSNQSGIGRGLISKAQHASVHDAFLTLLAREGCIIDGIYYCPHTPADDCTCRKPKPGMLSTAAKELGLSLKDSFMIGDRPSDVEAGRRAGCRTALVLTGPRRRRSRESHAVQNAAPADVVRPNLIEVARWIEEITASASA